VLKFKYVLRRKIGLLTLGAFLLAACGETGFDAMNSPGNLANTSRPKTGEDRILDRLMNQPRHNPQPQSQPQSQSQSPSPSPNSGTENDVNDSNGSAAPLSPPKASTPGSSARVVKFEVRGFWDRRAKQGKQWTAFTVQALKSYGRALYQGTPPADITQFCPRYNRLGESARIDFWVKLISAIAAPESSYNPNSSYREGWNERTGDPVISRGLLQISLGSSRGYGCGIKTANELHDSKKNLECGVKILSRWIPSDNVIVGQRGNKWLGGARYWSVLRTRNRNAKPIRVLLKESSHCRI